MKLIANIFTSSGSCFLNCYYDLISFQSNFIQKKLSIFLFMVYAFYDSFKKSVLNICHEESILSLSLEILLFIFKSLIGLELIFVYGLR